MLILHIIVFSLLVAFFTATGMELTFEKVMYYLGIYTIGAAIGHLLTK